MFEFGFYIKHFGSIEKDVFAKGKFGIRMIQEKEKKNIILREMVIMIG